MATETGISADPIVYAVGKNMTGYLPESSLFFTTDHASAKSALISDLDYAGDGYAQVDDNDLS